MNMAMSEGSAQSKALFESQANAKDVADSAQIHLGQMRYEKDLQRQEYETQLEDLRKKADSCWTKQDEEKLNFSNSRGRYSRIRSQIDSGMLKKRRVKTKS